MRIAFFLSERPGSHSPGGSPLVGGLGRGLQELGHSVEDYRPHVGYDLIIICNQCAHTTDYQYPAFPADNTPICFVDSAEHGYFKRLPSVVHQYANAFSPGSMVHDTKNLCEQRRLKEYLQGKSFPYLLREMSKHVEYPPGYAAIDYPLYWLSDCGKKPNREEYLRRPLDLFVSWGISHPWRQKLTEALRSAKVRSEVYVIEEEGMQRLPQSLYFQKTESAKCVPSFDGYGSSSFRLHEVLARTVLLRGPLSIRRYMDLTDGVNCVDYNVWNDGEEFLSTDICEKLAEVLADPERSFEIYKNGYEHCHQFYTEKATAQYLLETVASHDWTKPTQLDITAPVPA